MAKKDSVAVVETPVATKKRARNPEYEKAMAEVIKYVNEAEFSENEELEYFIDDKSKVVVCRRAKYEEVDFEPEDECECCDCCDGEVCAEPDGAVFVKVSYGLSKCCPNDRFNIVLGKYIALKRARSRPIPPTIRSVVFGK